MNRPALDRIPHRAPIRCLEDLVEVTTEHTVARGRASFGWEAWLIEGLAQTAALMNAVAYGIEDKGMLVQVRKLSFYRAPIADEPVEYRVELVRMLPPLSLVTGEVRDAAGELIAKGTLKFYVESDA